MSLANWTPSSGLVGAGARTERFDAQFATAVEVAYRELQLLVGRGYGVEWIDSYSMWESTPVSTWPAGRHLWLQIGR